jgi:hypothetical protein
VIALNDAATTAHGGQGRAAQVVGVQEGEHAVLSSANVNAHSRFWVLYHTLLTARAHGHALAVEEVVLGSGAARGCHAARQSAHSNRCTIHRAWMTAVCQSAVNRRHGDFRLWTHDAGLLIRHLCPRRRTP